MKMINNCVSAFDVVEVEQNRVVFANCSYNSICELDLKTGKCKIVYIFDGETPFSDTLYKRCVKNGEMIFFAPGRAKQIAIYNYKTNKCQYISLCESNGMYNERVNQTDAIGMVFAVDGFVYMCGFYFPGILKIEAATLKVTYINDWVEEVDKRIPEGDTCGFIGYGYWESNDYIYLPISGAPGILKINKHDDKTEIIWIDTNVNGFGALSYHDNKLWLIESRSKTGILTTYDLKKQKMEEIKYGVANDKYHPYNTPFFEGDMILLMPIKEDEALAIDINSKKTEVIEKMIAFTKGTPSFFVENILFSKRIGNYIYLESGIDYRWYKFDIINDKIEMLDLEIDNYDYMYEGVLTRIRNNEETLLKEEQIGLSNYINILKNVD